MPRGKGTYGSQVGRPPKNKKYNKGGKTKENFKPHMMYGNGQSKMANTYEEHMSLQKKRMGTYQRRNGKWWKDKWPFT